MQMPGRFWDALEKNVLVSSFIAAAMVLTACYMWATGQQIPPIMEGALMLVLGYFLGAKAQGVVNRKVR